MTKRGDQFQTIRTEGALLPPDILQSVASLKVDGVSPAAYHLPPGTKLNEAIAHSWSVLQKYWKGFQEARSRLDPEKTGTELTNQHWLLPLFEELKYGRLTTGKAPEIDGRTYPIERFYAQQPIHLIGCNLPLDRRTTGARGAATSSPYSMMQEYLNRSPDSVWGFLSNGLQLRLLRDNISLSRQAYVEFNLEAMMEGEVYADFALLWMLCHQSRIEADKPTDFWLEKWSHLARDLGTRVLADLRLGVTNAIAAMGKGFLAHPRNDRLREKLQSGQLDTQEYYRQLLRIVYRLLFLFVAEDRKLLHPPSADAAACELYDTYYSTRRLRDLADSIRGSKHADLWHSFSLICQRLNQPDGCAELGLIGLGSFLWNPANTADLLGPNQAASDNDAVLIKNDDLLAGVRALAYVEQDRVRRAVDYRNLGSEELGSVYESLLELHPILNVHARTFDLSVAAGNERKTTGSYYTPDSLVQCLLDSALDPVVQDRLQGKRGAEAEAALLNIKVCDPACGSGHFLIAAAHRLARHLGRIRTGESEPSPEDHQHALRDVIGRCMYGVDINRMAVELCKVSLWMEAIEPGKPLSFLDHHIQWGNSLLGTNPALLKQGIPDEAFTAIEGDDRVVVSDLKKQNKKEKSDLDRGQGLFAFEPYIKLGNLPASFAQLSLANDDSVADVAEKERRYAELVGGANYQNAHLLADMWCAVFVWQKDRSELGRLCPTENDFRRIENNPHSILPHVKAQIRYLADQYKFFHWHLAFPDVFRLPGGAETADNEQTGWNDGFDVVLGNPPWESSDLMRVEFFSTLIPEIHKAKTTKERESLIDNAIEVDDSLAKRWQVAKRKHIGEGHFTKTSGALPKTASGKLNTYRSFGELSTLQVKPSGLTGLILKSGIVNAQDNQEFFGDLVEAGRVLSIVDFINTKPIFPDIVGNERFCFFVISGRGDPTRLATYAFGLTTAEQAQRGECAVGITAVELKTINPNDLSVPPVTSAQDKALLFAVHNRFPVLVDLRRKINRFASRYSRGHLNSSSDSHLFDGNTYEVLTKNGEFLPDGRWNDSWQPLYEGKLLALFNHRFGCFLSVPESKRFGKKAEAKSLTQIQLDDPEFVPFPRFWLTSRDATKRFEQKKTSQKWMLAYRHVCRAIVDARTTQICLAPRVPSSDSVTLILFDDEPIGAAKSAIGILAAFSSFVGDYIVRQKLYGPALTKAILYQLPVPSLEQVESIWTFVCSCVLELTYTAWDLQDFALDCGYDGPPFRWDEERRFLLRCELDAAYFHLYLGPGREWGVESAADKPLNTGKSPLTDAFQTPRHAVDYILDSFPIVRRKDRQAHGEYRTKRVILEIYDAMGEAIRTGQPYHTRLNPPPGPPTDAAGNFIPMAQWDPNHWPSHIHPPRTAPTPQRVAAMTEPAFPRTPLDKVLCACLLDAVQLQAGLNEDQYVDYIVLATQSARCRLLLTGDDRKKFDRAVKSMTTELTADADAHPPWPSLLKCLLANQSLSRSERAIVTGNNFAAVRATLPAIDNQFAALVAKAAERLRELQEAVAPDAATITVVEELRIQHAAAMAETRG